METRTMNSKFDLFLNKKAVSQQTEDMATCFASRDSCMLLAESTYLHTHLDKFA